MKTLGTRIKSLQFIPSSIPLSSMEPWQAEEAMGVEDRQEDHFMERVVLQMMYDLKNDKQRLVLLFLLLREYGFQFDHKSISTSLNIHHRWYMRVKKSVLEILHKYQRML